MQKLYLLDTLDNTYNILNITNQTSTKWRHTSEEAIEYDKISTRKLEDNWGPVAGKSLYEVIDWLYSSRPNFQILEIIDEYW